MTGMPPRLTDEKRLRQMTAADLASEREWLRYSLQEIGRNIPEADGWLVTLYDEYAAALDSEISRSFRRDLLPRGGVQMFAPDEVDVVRQCTSMVALLRDYGKNWAASLLCTCEKARAAKKDSSPTVIWSGCWQW